MFRKKLIYIIIFLIVFSASCTSSPKSTAVSCESEAVNAYIEELSVQLENFDAAFDMERATSRQDVDVMLQNLQNVFQSVKLLNPPECAIYLQEYVLVSMQTEIDALVSYYSEDSDVIVSRKMEVSNRVREVVKKEFAAFKKNPVDAYTASEVESQNNQNESAEIKSFKLPENWKNVEFGDTQEYIFSIPESWNYSIFGENNAYVELSNPNETLFILLDTLDESFLGDYQSDTVRLFGVQTQIEMGGWDYYQEDSTNVSLFAKNKTFEFIFSKREYLDNEVTKSIWAIVVTPENQEIFMVINTKQANFAPADLENLRTIYSSIRPAE